MSKKSRVQNMNDIVFVVNILIAEIGLHVYTPVTSMKVRKYRGG